MTTPANTTTRRIRSGDTYLLYACAPVGWILLFLWNHEVVLLVFGAACLYSLLLAIAATAHAFLRTVVVPPQPLVTMLAALRFIVVTGLIAYVVYVLIDSRQAFFMPA